MLFLAHSAVGSFLMRLSRAYKNLTTRPDKPLSIRFRYRIRQSHQCRGIVWHLEQGEDLAVFIRLKFPLKQAASVFQFKRSSRPSRQLPVPAADRLRKKAWAPTLSRKVP